MKQKTLIDENGHIKLNVVVDTNNNIVIPKNIKIEENQQLVEQYIGDYVKPKWNGSEWVEGATKEEIKAWQEENKIEENTQPTEEQQLLSAVLLENSEIKEQLKEQQELIATILLQNAQLKGENANV